MQPAPLQAGMVSCPPPRVSPLERIFLSLGVPVHAMHPSAPPPPPPAAVAEIPPSVDLLSPHRLKPFTSYKFRVKATNDIGDSEFSEESEPLTTLQAGQCPPPAGMSFSWPTGPSLLGEGVPKDGRGPQRWERQPGTLSGSVGRDLRPFGSQGPLPWARHSHPDWGPSAFLL